MSYNQIFRLTTGRFSPHWKIIAWFSRWFLFYPWLVAIPSKRIFLHRPAPPDEIIAPCRKLAGRPCAPPISPMNKRPQSGAAAPKDAALPSSHKAEFIFYAQVQRDRSKPVKVFGEYACDFTRPDWQHRWKEWNAGLNPYLHLFLCGEHAREFGLSPAVDPRD